MSAATVEPMTFRLEPLNWWWLAAAAAAFALVVFVLAFAADRRAAGGRTAAAVLALRCGAVAVTVLFVLGPRVSRRGERSAAAPVAIVIDSSASMDYDDGGSSRLRKAVNAAASVAAAVREAGGDPLVVDVAASRRVRGMEVPSVASLAAADRNRSDVAGGLGEMARIYGRPGLAAVVLISDGGFSPLFSPEGLPACYTYTVGAAPPRDAAALIGVTAPALALAGTPATARVRYWSSRPAGAAASLEVTAYGGGSSVVPLRLNPGYGDAAAAFTVAEPGDHFFRVRLAPGRGERWVHARVPARPLVIWYREMAGDADFAAFRRALAANRGFDVRWRLDVGDRLPYDGAPEPPNPDVVIWGNPRADKFTAADARALEEYVANGGGLLLIVTARPPDVAALNGPLARLSPFEPSRLAAAVDGGQLVPGDTKGTVAFEALPPRVKAVWRLGRPKSAATPAWLGTDGTPALTFMPYGLGRVALYAGAGWFGDRLAGGPYDAAGAALILALYDPYAGPLALSRRIVSPGDVVEVTCRAPVEPTVTLAAPGGLTAVPMLAAGGGLWVGRVAADARGRYDLTARVAGAAAGGVERASFLVVAPDEESAVVTARPEVLANLAAATGGRAFAEGQERELAAAAAAAVKAAPREKITVEKSLWPPWLAFAAALACLGGAWFVRRRAGLR